MAERASHVALLCSARRRRERQLRSVWRHEQLSVKMAVSCAVHHSAQRFCFHAVVQTVDFSNMSDDESNVSGYVTPTPVVERPAPVAPAPVIEHVASAPANKFVTSAPVI